jgi:hypothetical protein
MMQHSPLIKADKLKKDSIKVESRRIRARVAKSKIICQKKEIFKEKLEEKFKKFFFRTHKEVRSI